MELESSDFLEQFKGAWVIFRERTDKGANAEWVAMDVKDSIDNPVETLDLIAATEGLERDFNKQMIGKRANTKP